MQKPSAQMHHVEAKLHSHRWKTSKIRIPCCIFAPTKSPKTERGKSGCSRIIVLGAGNGRHRGGRDLQVWGGKNNESLQMFHNRKTSLDGSFGGLKERFGGKQIGPKYDPEKSMTYKNDPS